MQVVLPSSYSEADMLRSWQQLQESRDVAVLPSPEDLIAASEASVPVMAVLAAAWEGRRGSYSGTFREFADMYLSSKLLGAVSDFKFTVSVRSQHVHGIQRIIVGVRQGFECVWLSH